MTGKAFSERKTATTLNPSTFGGVGVPLPVVLEESPMSRVKRGPTSSDSNPTSDHRTTLPMGRKEIAKRVLNVAPSTPRLDNAPAGSGPDWRKPSRVSIVSI